MFERTNLEIQSFIRNAVSAWRFIFDNFLRSLHDFFCGYLGNLLGIYLNYEEVQLNLQEKSTDILQ